MFDIAHYWVRYEFAPGRGQIHAHLLAIPNDQSIYIQAYDEGKKQKTHETKQQKKVEIIGKWTKNKFGLTASVDDGFDDISIDLNTSPVAMRLKDFPKNDTDLKIDKQKCLKYCQTHICSAFCLHENKKIKGYVIECFIILINKAICSHNHSGNDAHAKLEQEQKKNQGMQIHLDSHYKIHIQYWKTTEEQQKSVFPETTIELIKHPQTCYSPGEQTVMFNY